MPKEKTYTVNIAKIYKRKFEDMGMFFYVEGQLRIVPACTIEQALCSFFKFIEVDDYNLESAIVTFSQMRGEMIDLKYDEKVTSHT